MLRTIEIAKAGEVFVIDMGEPVRLLDLDSQMVELSGCTVRYSKEPDWNIAITFTAPIPGEKLYEDL